MMRGLVIYLIFISGLYIAAADPFSGEQQSGKLAQYLRLAGLLSLLGFMVGYDPTRFSHWIDLIPNPAQKKKDDDDDSADTPAQQATLQQAIVKAEEVEELSQNLKDKAEDLKEDLEEARDKKPPNNP